MIAQDAYYMNLPNYYLLKELCGFINDPKYSSSDIIDFIKLNKISINSYVKISEHTYAPLIYPVSITEKNAKLFRWLIKNKAKLDLQLDSISAEVPPDIEFVCYIDHISILKPNINLNIVNLEYCMKRADVSRINLLELSDVCRKHVKNNSAFVFNILETLIQKISMLCTSPGLSHAKNVDKAIYKYAQMFAMLQDVFSCNIGHPESGVSFIDLCITWYLFPIIKELRGYTEFMQPIFYEDMNKEVVAIYRQIYNEHFYYNTCIALRVYVDPRVDIDI
jgi:hypothetical protein